MSSFSRKDGSEAQKRSIMIKDDSNHSIELTLWGDKAAAFPEPEGSGNAQVVAFKGMRVSEWNQRSLGAMHSTIYELNPELEATERLMSVERAHGTEISR